MNTSIDREILNIKNESESYQNDTKTCNIASHCDYNCQEIIKIIKSFKKQQSTTIGKIRDSNFSINNKNKR